MAPIALRRMFPESRMREIRPSGLMRGGSWLTHLGQLLPTLPPSARPDGNGISRRSSSEPLADEPTSGDSITVVPTARPRQARRTRAVRHRPEATDPKARLADVELRPPPFRSPASLGPYLAAMTCIRPGECAVFKASLHDPFGSALTALRRSPKSLRHTAESPRASQGLSLLFTLFLE